ncbi:MAG: methylthioribulose 1-phosphate dehydratase [Pseudanabaenaceae cyanobacterium bins.68]|nr:methylthioribulose 1-phosphate dehydratase [Pseudanabaenaceae cyanobacterium bins.68]
MLNSPDPRVALAWAIANIHGKGWATGTGGNFSLVLERDPLVLLMAPSGVDKGLVQPEQLIKVDSQAQVLEGNGKASAETFLHLAIASTLGAGAILHTHSIFNTLMSELYAARGAIEFTNHEMLKGLAGITSHDQSLSLPILPNSQDMPALAVVVRDLLTHQPHIAPGILLAGHGLYAWGKNLFEARRHLEILEFLLELNYRRRSLGLI